MNTNKKNNIIALKHDEEISQVQKVALEKEEEI